MAALTNLELTDRIIELEKALTILQVAFKNLASKKQLSDLNFINQRNIKDVQDRLSISEADVKFLKSQL